MVDDEYGGLQYLTAKSILWSTRSIITGHTPAIDTVLNTIDPMAYHLAVLEVKSVAGQIEGLRLTMPNLGNLQ